MKPFRRYHNKEGKLLIPKVCTNAYFCFGSLDCLKLEHDSINYWDLYMGNYYFNQLTPENVAILKQKGYWEPILENQKQVIANGPYYEITTTNHCILQMVNTTNLSI